MTDGVWIVIFEFCIVILHFDFCILNFYYTDFRRKTFLKNPGPWVSFTLTPFVSFSDGAGLTFSFSFCLRASFCFFVSFFGNTKRCGKVLVDSWSTTVTWLVILWIGVARPCARGSHRFNIGPLSTRISDIISASRFAFFATAPAAAERRSFKIGIATRLFWRRSWASASESGRRFTVFTISRTFRGAIWRCRRCAVWIIINLCFLFSAFRCLCLSCGLCLCHLCRGFKLALDFSAVLHKFPRQRKFAKPMTDHFFFDKHVREYFSVMNADCKPNHLWRNFWIAWPCFNHGFIPRFEFRDLLE